MSELIIAARRYLGVRFVHRGRRKDKLDCVGLIWRAYLDCGVELFAPGDYGREPHVDRFRAAIEAALGAPVRGPLQVGDIVTLRTLKHAHHLAMVCDHPAGLGLIHASGEHGRVVEHRLDPAYRARITHVYRRPV
jgi:cell wall-associated NlpC family hydrolase